MCFLGKAATGEPLVPLVRGNLTAITPEFPVLGYCHFEIHSTGWGKWENTWKNEISYENWLIFGYGNIVLKSAEQFTD